MKTNKQIKREDNGAMAPFIEWKRALQEGDIQEFGCVVPRPESAYHLLYDMYKKVSEVK